WIFLVISLSSFCGFDQVLDICIARGQDGIAGNRPGICRRAASSRLRRVLSTLVMSSSVGLSVSMRPA
ncbi:MAG: hypothetical protein AAGI13_07685, partial [Pseudomonadota bacterium]